MEKSIEEKLVELKKEGNAYEFSILCDNTGYEPKTSEEIKLYNEGKDIRNKLEDKRRGTTLNKIRSPYSL
jgi:hypothetical protein